MQPHIDVPGREARARIVRLLAIPDGTCDCERLPDLDGNRAAHATAWCGNWFQPHASL